jgi:alpha-mannosidase
MDIPLGVIRPEVDQIPGACKNWLTVGRWADASNAEFGVTWITLDAPLVEVGGITATLLNSQTNPRVWRATIEPTQQLYSWVMNNHWGTNYRAYQAGPVVFRYVLRPHRGPGSDVEATRCAIGYSQPLVAVPGRGPAPDGRSLVRVEPAEVIVTAMKPSDDGRAIIMRLLAVSNQQQDVRLIWSSLPPERTWISDTSERPRKEMGEAVRIPGWGLTTLRVELPLN